MARQEADLTVNVTEYVEDRRGHVRWVVIATFVGPHSSEPRCIDYRVRVVPDMDTEYGAKLAAAPVRQDLEADTNREDRSDTWYRAEVSAPAEGIPQRVFEQASQARLLAKAREVVTRHPDALPKEAARMIERQSQRRVGRPPARTLGERLRILEDVEHAFASGTTIEEVARKHHMSRSAVRDLISWARRDSDPQLFSSAGPGRTGGELTAAARALLDGEA